MALGAGGSTEAPGSGIDSPAPSADWQGCALTALGDAMAVLDVSGTGRVLWRNAALCAAVAHTPTQKPTAAAAADANDWPPVGTPLAQLCERLEGLTAGLCAVAQWPGCDEGWAGTVELCGEQAAADRDTPLDAPVDTPVDATVDASLENFGDAQGHAHRGAEAGRASAAPVVARARPARLAPVAAQQGLWALWLGPDNGALNPTRRHLEDRERLLFTSHSLAVGEMATTLAHELNQPLGAVSNVLRGLKARLASAGEDFHPQRLPALAQGVQLALEQVQYAAKVIGRVRDYTRNHQPQREPLDTLTLLRSSLALLDWDLERHAVQWTVQADGIEHALQQRGWAVVADGVMVQQVLVNLLRNAIDAMATSPAHERRLEVMCRIDEADQMLELAIRDSGCGMEDGTAAQLFMPFFSTKPNGMGVGLNICRSLIELHQGRLWFTPNADRGCTFFVALPLVATPAPVAQAGPRELAGNRL